MTVGKVFPPLMLAHMHAALEYFNCFLLPVGFFLINYMLLLPQPNWIDQASHFMIIFVVASRGDQSLSRLSLVSC